MTPALPGEDYPSWPRMFQSPRFREGFIHFHRFKSLGPPHPYLHRWRTCDLPRWPRFDQVLSTGISLAKWAIKTLIIWSLRGWAATHLLEVLKASIFIVLNFWTQNPPKICPSAIPVIWIHASGTSRSCPSKLSSLQLHLNFFSGQPLGEGILYNN